MPNLGKRKNLLYSLNKKKKQEVTKFSTYKSMLSSCGIDFQEIGKNGKGVSLLHLNTFEARNTEISVTVYSVKHKKFKF